MANQPIYRDIIAPNDEFRGHNTYLFGDEPTTLSLVQGA